ncbi:MAG TPA: heme exporter protein CcmB [Thermoanaerobaculia bacterium]|nr:heme exporter protein CcmB [Thermoanaerobaculia bacterium]
MLQGTSVLAKPSAWGSAEGWAAEVVAVFVKDWRCEFRTRYALNTLALFALTTMVVMSISLGPLGIDRTRGTKVLPVLLWVILLFSVSAGLPRAFIQEEESQTATALRLSATPSALFCGKLLYCLTLVGALELLVTPIFVTLMNLEVISPALLVGTLAAGGYGLAVGSTLVAAIIAQARTKGTLFSVLAFPVLLPLLLLAVELTFNAVAGGGGGVALPQLLLYDASVTVVGLMLFPVVWNP